MKNPTKLQPLLLYQIFAISSLFLCYGSKLQAQHQQHEATLTRYVGQVTILMPPASPKAAGGTKVKFEGEPYLAAKPSRGLAIPLGSVIQTGAKSVARLIYPNGDQVTVVSHSNYKFSLESKGAASNKPVIDMLYGAFRATVSKSGPRNDLKVRAKTLSMGVRGTEFFMEATTPAGHAAVTVIRGKVAVKAKNSQKEVTIPSGYQIAAAGGSKGVLKPQKTSREQIKKMHRATKVKANPEAKLSPAQAKKIAALEKKAVQTTLVDIKEEDPALYQTLSQQVAQGKKVDLDDIQQKTLQKAYKKAPIVHSKKAAKPKADDLDFDDDELEEKYKK